ncbi:hypothetical protein QFZ82_000258 [Streptomyces sp. V4I23]|uniref:hypothetical protein n=1 Tax=Streptomyces sp. V4I23 TaxID=3042282 RepID=UPI0027822176|nr:hypothetical protein [Streptomyces sp. V4I23]MDQ1005773.1 hypothetical protein [Streptomyces sp. V4I23]
MQNSTACPEALGRVKALVESAIAPIVVVDFSWLSAAGTLSDLLHRKAAGHGLYRIDAVECLDQASPGASIRELAGACAEQLRQLGIQPAAVVGYCGASGLAMELSRELNPADGAESSIVLVEPTWPTMEDVLSNIAEVRSAVGAQNTWTGPLTVEAIIGQLADDIDESLRAGGVPEPDRKVSAKIVLERYQAWFKFLLAVAETQPPEARSPVTVLTGHDSANGPAATWAPELVRLQRISVAESDMLTSDRTSQYITEISAIAWERIEAVGGAGR